MLKRSIEYEDYDGNARKEDFYFNMSNPEAMRLEMSFKGGMSAALSEIMKNEDAAKMWDFFEKIILTSYGEKSEDGKRFRKKDDNGVALSIGFEETPAYSALITEFMQDSDKASEFFNAVFSKEISDIAAQEELKQKMAEKMGTKAPVPTTAELAAAITRDTELVQPNPEVL